MPSAPRTARALARAELTRAILDRASVQLAEVGPAALSVRQIARDLEMASSAVYRYFPSRDALLTALLIQAFDDLGQAVEDGDAERGARRLPRPLGRPRPGTARLGGGAPARVRAHLRLTGPRVRRARRTPSPPRTRVVQGAARPAPRRPGGRPLPGRADPSGDRGRAGLDRTGPVVRRRGAGRGLLDPRADGLGDAVRQHLAGAVRPHVQGRARLRGALRDAGRAAGRRPGLLSSRGSARTTSVSARCESLLFPDAHGTARGRPGRAARVAVAGVPRRGRSACSRPASCRSRWTRGSRPTSGSGSWPASPPRLVVTDEAALAELRRGLPGRPRTAPRPADALHERHHRDAEGRVERAAVRRRRRRARGRGAVALGLRRHAT